MSIEFSKTNFDFFADDSCKEIKEANERYYKLMIADDDKEVHAITTMILKNFEFEGFKLKIIHAYSGEEAKVLLNEHADTAILFLDVVMETHNSGLEVVSYLRGELNNQLTRIVLRTGQPGEAPEEDVIKQYDINDYRLKTELTVKRMHTTLYTALRNFRDLMKIERHKQGFERIIKASSQLFRHQQVSDFLTSILEELSNLYQGNPNFVYMRDDETHYHEGFVGLEQLKQVKIVAGTGKYSNLVGRTINDVPDFEFMKTLEINQNDAKYKALGVPGGFMIRSASGMQINNYIFISTDNIFHDFELINLFLEHYSEAFDNYLSHNLLMESQTTMLDAYSTIIERHFKNPLDHISKMSYFVKCFALKLGYDEISAVRLGHAATLHDLGMIKLPDALIMSHDTLSEIDYEKVKEHTRLGHDLLVSLDAEVLRLAAEIALCHHEHYDGTGYPRKLKGNVIPESARMVAIVDVYVSMSSEKVYSKGFPEKSAMDYILDKSGTQFDPQLVESFLDCIVL